VSRSQCCAPLAADNSVACYRASRPAARSKHLISRATPLPAETALVTKLVTDIDGVQGVVNNLTIE
jgi:hypothetical protein